MNSLLTFFASRVALAGTGFLAGVLLAWNVQGQRIDAVQAGHERYMAQTAQAAAQQELQWQKEKEDAIQEREIRLAQLETERDALAATSGRLRRDAAALRERLANAPGPARLDAAATVGELLAECAEAYRDMADKAQRHADDVRTLMKAWPISEDRGQKTDLWSVSSYQWSHVNLLQITDD